MKTKKQMQRFLSIFLACIMILNVPMSALAFEDVMIAEEVEMYAEQEENTEENIAGIEGGDTESEEDWEAEILEEENLTEETSDVQPGLEHEEGVWTLSEQDAADFVITEIEVQDIDPMLTSLEAEEDEVAVSAADVEVYLTVSVKGVPAQAKDGSAMLDRSVTVKDINGDGKLTYDEALTAAHETYFEGGASAGYGSETTDYGLSLTKLWGDTSYAYGYWNNDMSCWSLADEVKDGDCLNAFVYKDSVNYSDCYIRFDNATYMIQTDVECEVSVEKAVWDNTVGAYVFQNCTGVAFSIYDSDHKLVSDDDYTVSNEGILFKNAGIYYLVASGTESQILVPVSAKVIVSQNPTTALKGITLDYTTRTVPAEKDDYTSLKATLEPADIEKVVITWTSSNPEVAKVEDGKVYALSPGETVITASAGNVKAECTYKVTLPPTLSSVKCYTDANAYKAGTVLKMTPEFNENQQSGYTVFAPDYLTSLYIEGTIAPEYVKEGYNTIYFANAWGSNSGYKTDANGVKAYTATITGNQTKVFANRAYPYQLDISRYTTLKSLVTDGRMQETFDKNNNIYHVLVDQSMGTFGVTPTAYNSAYTIKVNDTEVTSGGTCEIPYNWDENGKMTVLVEVSGENMTSSTYTLELGKTDLGTAPVIQTQPQNAEYIVQEKASALEVDALTNGTLTYQWYSNDKKDTDGGQAIENATEKTYIPSTETVGTVYYYCIVTNTEATENNKTVTDVVSVVVDVDPTPVATLSNVGSAMPEDGYEYAWSKGYVYQVGAEAAALTVSATTNAVDGELTYAWKKISNAYAPSGTGSAAGGTNDTTSYTPQTLEANASTTGAFYGCQVTCTFKGKKYTSWATTGETYTVGEGENEKTYDVIGVYVFTKTDHAATPTFTKTPTGGSYIVGNYPSIMYANATKADGGTLTYQWYVNDTNSTENGTPITGATKYYYSIGKVTEAGTKYYYCIATNTNQGYTASATSAVAEIIVSDESSGGDDTTVEIDLQGEGTKESPYLIKTAQDYITVAELVEDGFSFAGKYLRQERNITLPKGWQSIGVTKDGTSDIKSGSNLNPFSGILDGNGKTLTVPEGGLPLLGYVKGAEVYNLNIYGKKIAGYGLVNHYVGVGLSGTGIIIDNVTLKSGSSTLKSGLIGTYTTTNGYAGCSAGFMGTIRNCTIEEGVVIGYQKDQSMIGSIAGRFQGSIEKCVSRAEVYGVNYVGGIIGTCDNALSECKVTGCSFGGTVTASGTYAGGIAGGGYSNSTAPNGLKMTITDCTVSGNVTGTDYVGGILGGDGYVAQTWSAHTIKGNSFTGNVQAVSGKYVGGIIGFFDSLNKNDIVVSNYYKADCGTEKGIGFIKYVDTSYANPTAVEGTVYFNTEESTAGCPEITGAYWHTGLNRSDDPLGVHAKKLASTNPNQEPEVINLVVSGEFEKTYYAGQKFDTTGMSVTAEWSDDTSTNVNLEDLDIDDSAMTEKGWKEVKITYQGMSTSISVRVLSSIKVTFSLLGDTKHESDKDGKIHTLADANLETWIPETIYYVSPDATVYDVILEAADQYGFKIIGDADNQYDTMYIEGITWNGVTLKELDNGPNSGWMDVINGEHPNVGVSRQTLQNNDVIIFHYTDDYTVEESKAFDRTQAEEAAENITSLPAADKLTLSDKAAVQAARAAYEALTDSQKELVNADVLKALEAAEARIAELESAAAPSVPHTHSWDAGTVTKAATCKTTGSKTYKCACGEAKTETIPVSNDHKYGSWTKASDATVFAAETQKHTCSVCGASETKNVGSKLKAVLEVPGKLTSISIKKGNTKTLNVTMANGDSVASVKSSAPKTLKVTLDKNGKITLKALKKGSAKLTIKLASKTQKTYTVKVVTGTVKTTKVTVTSTANNKLTLKQGKTHQLKTELKPFTSTQKVTYKTSNKKVATVTSAGKIKAVGAGKATITVTSGSKKVKVTVTVPGITGLKSSVSVKKNKTLTLKPKTYGISEKVTYTSSDPKVATVTAAGKVKGIKKGTAKITVQAGSYKKTVTVKVK